MSWVAWFFFESLPALSAALFTANFILLVLWRRTGRVRPLLVGLTLSLALVIMQGVVVTRRERAARVLGDIERDLVAGQTSGLAAALADDFRAGPLNREQFLGLAARQLGRLRIYSLHRSQLEVRESQPERFVVETAYQADLRSDVFGGWVRSRWELTFARVPDGWRIAAIRPLFVDGLDKPDSAFLEQP